MSSVLTSNIDRIKNILAGKHTEKSKSSVGYRKHRVKHKEGDVWEDQGKTWTVINGITQTMTSLDEARAALHIPWTCPQCNKPLKHLLDKRAWKTTKKCFDCVTYDESLMELNGTFDEYKKATYKENALAWLNEKREQFELFINDTDTLRGFVTQNGEIENWTGGPDKEKLKAKFEEEYALFKKKIDEM